MPLPTPNNGMDAIDPVQYGRLLASVENQKEQIVAMKVDMDTRMTAMAAQIAELLELANKSKGGFWVGMSVAAGVGSFATWVLTHLFGQKP